MTTAGGPAIDSTLLIGTYPEITAFADPLAVGVH